MSTPRALRLGFAGLADTPPDHLSVDGMTPKGPNLSHWPGNRTPPIWKADLSTGICLRFARADPRAQNEFLGPAETVLNDHYDTDGFLSLLAVLRPEIALHREELCLLAAATGDFQAFHTERAFAVDRIVYHLDDPDRSPLAGEFAGLEGAERSLARYRWLLDHAAQVLDRPQTLAPLWTEELARVREQLAAGAGGALERRLHPALGFSVLQSRTPFARIVLNTLAGAWRVLHVVQTKDGPCYRYHDRTESWFELVTFTPPPRRDLRPLAARLNALEESAGGTPSWHADPPDEPVPELYHGPAAAQAYGEVTRELSPSRLSEAAVEQAFSHLFAT